MLQHLRPALVMLIAFTLLTGLIYPLSITGVASLAMPRQADGSLITGGGKVIGSSLIGQAFTGDKYFHPRPSAAGNGYDAANSSGSNLGPINKKLLDRVRGDVAALRKQEVEGPIPADAVTTSASGLDPDISPATALMQAPRVAQARGIPLEKIKALIATHTEERAFKLFGEPCVNVLQLNLALDALQS